MRPGRIKKIIISDAKAQDNYYERGYGEGE
jgi:hypothetical protein